MPRHPDRVGTRTSAYRNSQCPEAVDAVVGELAGRQHGVVTTRQMLEAGLTGQGIRRRVQAGRLYPLHRGVYAVGHQALTSRSRFIAAVYACGPGALLSHRAAGALQGLLGSTGRIEVTAPRGCKPKPGITIHRARNIHDQDRTLVAAVPATTTARTLVDLADVLSEKRLAKAVHQA